MPSWRLYLDQIAAVLNYKPIVSAGMKSYGYKYIVSAYLHGLRRHGTNPYGLPGVYSIYAGLLLVNAYVKL